MKEFEINKTAWRMLSKEHYKKVLHKRRGK